MTSVIRRLALPPLIMKPDRAGPQVAEATAAR